MSDLEKDDMEDLAEEPIVVMTDEEGNEYYYREEVIIPVGEKRFAILVPIDIEDECGCGDEECGCEDETDVFIARIDVDEDGEEIYVDPTDEEFDEVREAYEQLLAEEEDEA
jgi:uncharacterized protein YrzB (UPF0473 family)